MVIRDKAQKGESKGNISVASEKNQRFREGLACLLGNSSGWVRESKGIHLGRETHSSESKTFGEHQPSEHHEARAKLSSHFDIS